MKADIWNLDLEKLIKETRTRAVLCYGNEGTLATYIHQSLLSQGQTTVVTEKEFLKDPDSFGQPDLFSASCCDTTRQVLMIEDVQDRHVQHYQRLLEDPFKDRVLYFLFGAPLRSASRMVRFFQSADNAIALPCYPLTHETYTRFLIQAFKTSPSLSGMPKAWVLTLANQLPIASVHEFIEKCSLLYDHEANNSSLSLENYLALIHQEPEGLKDIALTLAEKNMSQLGEKLSQPCLETSDLIFALRQCVSYFLSLVQAKGFMQQGASKEQAVGRISPPLFFKHQKKFQEHLNHWSLEGLYKALELLAQSELALKKTSNPYLSLQYFLDIARL